MIEPEYPRSLFLASFAFVISKIPAGPLLAVFPRSRFDANLVALRIRSGKLVKLLLTSGSFPSMFSAGGGARSLNCETLRPAEREPPSSMSLNSESLVGCLCIMGTSSPSGSS